MVRGVELERARRVTGHDGIAVARALATVYLQAERQLEAVVVRGKGLIEARLAARLGEGAAEAVGGEGARAIHLEARDGLVDGGFDAVIERRKAAVYARGRSRAAAARARQVGQVAVGLGAAPLPGARLSAAAGGHVVRARFGAASPEQQRREQRPAVNTSATCDAHLSVCLSSAPRAN